MAAKHTTAKTAAPKRKAKPARSIADRAAEVEANLGGSEPLKDFCEGGLVLSRIGYC